MITDIPSQLLQATPPGHIVSNYDAGNMHLKKGDFAVFQLQFRVGDDDTILNDWQALDAIESISIPWAPWDNATPPAFTALGLPSLHRAPLVQFAGAEGRLLCAPFDHTAVHAYFADFIKNGQDAFVRSHFEASSAVLLTGINDSMFTMADRLLKRIAEEGRTDMLLERLNACGRSDIVEKMMQ